MRTLLDFDLPSLRQMLRATERLIGPNTSSVRALRRAVEIKERETEHLGRIEALSGKLRRRRK
jgi:hypothetical protein